ncbi:MAG TPA: methionyl-tRNA formyltransferase [Proteobacteria bacterium]|nr:methionyl-tRNA formyltransferase [bacterium BMS3Abin14]HDL53325.1 methionyl-tRNA formyltransferase [Pseudomonadota bacterium]
MRLLFMGSPGLAVPALEATFASGDLVGVVTQPPRKKGRGLKVVSSPVALRALQLGFEPVTPSSVRDKNFQAFLLDLHPDLVVVMAYGKILPPEVLAIPRLGCINIHTSLLPELRGAAPIQWAIARGYTATGVTLMQMDEGMDTGPILLQKNVEIGPNETSEQLGKRLACLAAETLLEGIPALAGGELRPEPQDDSRATYAPMLTRKDGRINWSMDSRTIAARMRGFFPWPGAFTTRAGRRLRVTAAVPMAGKGSPPGTIMRTGEDGIEIACGTGSLMVSRLCPEGKREMGATEFISGYRPMPGERLGG